MSALPQFIRKIAIYSAIGAAVFGLSGVAALAAESSALANDPVIENPGLLPTNPFYFLKRVRRLTQRAITLNAVKRAELELDILNQKAAELKRLMEITEDDAEAVLAAIKLYEESLGRLQSYLSAVRENSDNAQTAAFLGKLFEISFKHFRVFGELETDKEVLTVERLEKMQLRLAEILVSALDRLDRTENLLERLEKTIAKQKNDFSDLTASLLALDRLEEKIGDNLLLARIFLDSEEDLVLELAAWLESGNINSLAVLFDDLPGNGLKLIQLLDTLRDRPVSSDLKNTLTIIRQRLLDDLKDRRILSKADSEKAIAEARRLVNLLSEALANSELKNSSSGVLLARAQFNLTQAEASFAANQPGEAFGQATAAIAAARNSLGQLLRLELKNGRPDLNKTLSRLKNDYDSLMRSLEDGELTAETAPNLFVLLTAVEKSIVKIADLAADKSVSVDRINLVLRDTKLLLKKAEQEFKNILRQLEAATASKKAGQSLIEKVKKGN